MLEMSMRWLEVDNAASQSTTGYYPATQVSVLWDSEEDPQGRGSVKVLLINKLTEPGDIKRIELRPDTVRVVLRDGTERVYTDNEPRYREQADPGYLDAMADAQRGAQ